MPVAGASTETAEAEAEFPANITKPITNKSRTNIISPEAANASGGPKPSGATSSMDLDRDLGTEIRFTGCRKAFSLIESF